MKNKFKKLLAFAIFAIMAMAMAVTAMADGTTYTLSINYVKNNQSTPAKNTYSIYQIASGNVETLNGSQVLTNISVNNEFAGVLTDAKLAEIESLETDNSVVVALAKKLAAITNANGFTMEAGKMFTGVTSGSIAGLAPGYYLVKETLHTSGDASIATKYILTTVVDNTTVNLKTSEAGITKKIILEDKGLSGITGASDTGTLVDANVAAIGDTIRYQIDSQIPEYPADATDLYYVITDEMSAGLNYAGIESIKTGTTDIGGSCTVTNPVGENAKRVEIKVDNSILVANGGATITVILKAELNSNAQVGSNGNPNSVDLEYTNNWDTKEKHKTPKDTVITYTGELKIKKVDQDNQETLLGGAEFAIYGPREDKKAADNPEALENGEITKNGKTYYYYQTITTSSEDATKGTATIAGLDAGTYYAKETKAPDGYSLKTDEIEIVLSVAPNNANCALENESGVVAGSENAESLAAANSTAVTNYQVTWNGDNDETTITNKKGTTLPGTGGMGTTIFTIGGIVLVALAALMFVVYMRKQKKQA